MQHFSQKDDSNKEIPFLQQKDPSTFLINSYVIDYISSDLITRKFHAKETLLHLFHNCFVYCL
jgi:hypothetical protein